MEQDDRWTGSDPLVANRRPVGRAHLAQRRPCSAGAGLPVHGPDPTPGPGPALSSVLIPSATIRHRVTGRPDGAMTRIRPQNPTHAGRRNPRSTPDLRDAETWPKSGTPARRHDRTFIPRAALHRRTAGLIVSWAMDRAANDARPLDNRAPTRRSGRPRDAGVMASPASRTGIPARPVRAALSVPAGAVSVRQRRRPAFVAQHDALLADGHPRSGPGRRPGVRGSRANAAAWACSGSTVSRAG